MLTEGPCPSGKAHQSKVKGPPPPPPPPPAHGLLMCWSPPRPPERGSSLRDRLRGLARIRGAFRMVGRRGEGVRAC
eukprot:6735366-Pyramimonas_sp.AAC.1